MKSNSISRQPWELVSPRVWCNNVTLIGLRPQNLPALVSLVNFLIPCSNVEILRSENKETGNLLKAERDN